MKRCAIGLIICGLSVLSAASQIPTPTGIKILRAEDSRQYDSDLEALMRSPNAEVRSRAALAAGRIGNDAAIPVLVALMDDDPSTDVRVMAAFAIGEIESVNGADAILKVLNDTASPVGLLGRAMEAAGKIAAANPRDAKFKPLGDAIAKALETQTRPGRNVEATRLGLTAVLRARPEGGDALTAKFLTDTDAGIRGDAANTLTRIRAKNANETLRRMLSSDPDANARANAARALGAAEDRGAVEALVNAALKDADSRVRVSAIGSLTTLRDASVTDHLINRGRELLKAYERSRVTRANIEKLPAEKSELLTIATALSRLQAGTKHTETWKFLEAFRNEDKHYSSEIEVAMVRVDPPRYLTVANFGGVEAPRRGRKPSFDWRVANSRHAALGEYATFTDESPYKETKVAAEKLLAEFLADPLKEFPFADPVSVYPAVASALSAYARFRPADLSSIALGHLTHDDPDIRAAAAGALAGLPPTKEHVDALKTALVQAMKTDKDSNDAQLAILGAVVRLDKRGSLPTVLAALNAPDNLVRWRAVDLLRDREAWKDVPAAELAPLTELAARERNVWPHDPKSGTRLGQVLNRDADYRRALARRNGSVSAVLTTDKGTFTIEFFPEEAPLTVDNWVKLARSGYFNGLRVHRVVPNFVMQDGDPRGDGNGGPGWTIRCEINMHPFERGTVGMALSGKDTGGSQWFVDHSPQPHLDGGYTVFGRVSEAGMKVVDKIVRGDRILNVRIIGR